jgi:oxygen-independent coproporphyrinogen-3 oxidase
LTALIETFLDRPYNAYVYAYPHKTAYRTLTPARELSELWEDENKESLFLYFHIPFCEQRCGYCNLFTTARSTPETRRDYLGQLAAQARAIRQSLGPEAAFARFAVGGGTPSLLEIPELKSLFTIASEDLGVDPRATPISFEVSPETLSPEKLACLKDAGVNRISIGVQSFIPEELRGIARHAGLARVIQSLDWIRETGFESLNMDLIYGLPGQTRDTWQETLNRTLAFEPEEIYLYPLYVRPLTGLALAALRAEKSRPDLYCLGRDALLAAGYRQLSMRHFRRNGPEMEAPDYTCQEDGMVGLGCGARSYTRSVHYSSEYAVGLQGVQEILHEYIHLPAQHFTRAHHGFILNHDEQARRYCLKSILLKEGLALADYRRYLGSHALNDLPELHKLLDEDLAILENERLRLTETGLMLSDAIGPWLYSQKVRERIEAYELR